MIPSIFLYLYNLIYNFRYIILKFKIYNIFYIFDILIFFIHLYLYIKEFFLSIFIFQFYILNIFINKNNYFINIIFEVIICLI